MKKPLLIAFIVFDVILVGLVVAIMMQPDTYKVERSIVVDAPADVVFPYANNYKKWNEWSPWAKLDPNIKTTYEGAEEGKGAIYKWSGNDDVGTGQMTIVESVENKKVAHDLKFITPFESEAKTAILLDETDGKTKVTWTMSGNNDFMSKAFSLFMNMEEMIGKDYEKGLNNLKPIVEKAAKETVGGRLKEAAGAVGDAAKGALDKLGELVGAKDGDAANDDKEGEKNAAASK